MRYEGRIFRPPSEGRSYILQATIGCKHNACAFCDMYREKKFRVRPVDEICDDIRLADELGYDPTRVFIADGDALSIATDQLIEILTYIEQRFKNCERVGIYATAEDILNKSLEELKLLHDEGLGIIYLGLESGDDTVLKRMNKGVDTSQMIEAAKRVKASGIALSVTVISGLGGKEGWENHARHTGQVLSEMDPDYIGLLTLMLEPGAPLHGWIKSGAFEVPGADEILKETECMLENIHVTDCAFRSNHASNYVSLKAHLPVEKDQALSALRNAMQSGEIKPESYRRL